MKRIISLIMVLVLALSLVPTTVWATEGTPAADVASVTDGSGETQKFASLQEAFEYVAALDVKEPTVTLLTDTTEDVTISANVTFDLGGKVLTGTGKGDTATLTVAEGAVAAVKNGSVKGTANSYYNIQNNGTATLEDVTATAGNTDSSMIDNWGDLTITSGEYSGGLNVVKSEEGSVLKINGGTFTLNYAASDYNYTAVILVYGDTTITDGTFVQTATPKWGYPQVVMTGLVEGYTAITRITGGTFINKKSGSNIFHGYGKATSDNFEVSGGTFNKSISAGYCADGYIPTGRNADGTYGVKQGSYAVKIGSTGYETFADAYKKVGNGKTITLLKDITESVSIGKNITIDLNNFKLTYTNMDTPLVKSGKTLTIANGTLNITGGICEGTLKPGKNGKIVVTGGTFSSNPTDYVHDEHYKISKGLDGLYTVSQKDQDDGTGGKTSVVELPAETTKNTTTATIDVADIDANKELSVVGGDVSVTFDQNAAAGIAGAAGNSTELNLTVEKTEPSAEQEKIYDDKLVNTTNEVVVNVTLTADGKPVFDAAKAGGKATVQVPYQVGLKKADISVYYLNNGKTEKVPFTYDAETGIITMTLEHFSAYLITTATHPSITPVDSKPTYIKGSNKDLGFTTVDLPEKITVKVGDKTLTEGKDYTVSDGKLTLTGAYLETLDYGNYTLKVFDENGNEIAKTSFAKSFAARPAQQPAQSGNKNSTSTKDDVKSAGTGDMGVALYAVSAVLSLTGSAWIVGKKRSK